MYPSVVRVWTADVPVEWERALREFSPVSRVIPWLAIRWFALKKRPIGRWLLSECIPVELIAPNDRDIITVLEGPRPSTLPIKLRDVVTTFVNDYQWEMYRSHRVWARELWVIEGKAGGHATAYSPAEQDVLRVCGMPTDPPRVGDLPYAPLDTRVFGQMRARNRLTQMGNDLDRLRKSGDSELMKAEEAQQAKDYRRLFVNYVEQQSIGRADFITWFSSKSDNRDILPAATEEQIRQAAMAKDYYIETGELPNSTTNI